MVFGGVVGYLFGAGVEGAARVVGVVRVARALSDNLFFLSAGGGLNGKLHCAGFGRADIAAGYQLLLEHGFISLKLLV